MRSMPVLLVSTKVTFGRLKVGRNSSLKVGRLHHGRYQAFSASAVDESLTVRSTRARVRLPFLKSTISPRTFSSSEVRSTAPLPSKSSLNDLNSSVQPSLTKSLSTGMPASRHEKLWLRSFCHPGRSDFAQSESVGLLPRSSIADGVRWNTYKCLAARPTCGTHCTPVAPVPMRPTRLSPSLSSFPADEPPV